MSWKQKKRCLDRLAGEEGWLRPDHDSETDQPRLRRREERTVASLFTPGDTHAGKGKFAGMKDFAVAAYLVILPEISKDKRYDTANRDLLDLVESGLLVRLGRGRSTRFQVVQTP